MIIGLLGILASYGLAVLGVHLAYARTRRSRGDVAEPQVVFLTRNGQDQIEWYIRSLQWSSSLRGRPVAVTLLDEGSTDQTVAIASRLARRGMRIDVREWDGTGGGDPSSGVRNEICVDLRGSGELRPLPVW
ncbi:hypothetical protein ACFQWB_14840 [Paenibacillus thermoaerophilus]|uniref:Glycosyl transferase family 2 n=1 Tax=Paenibacillus thermoaerophilus TaxID=1215385 RepID=A0ABW2V8H8_9BACL|nr:glycosyltransferase family A protein [Paenibacillus thermoaerophilus]TMV12516.1 glycosyltransferase family 2 protein [Paenibacillus thermoaerophilus]